MPPSSVNSLTGSGTKAEMRKLGLILGLLAASLSPAFSKSALIQDCPDCPKLVVLPPSPLGRWAFSQTEITFDQWQSCVNAKACRGGQDDHHWGKGNRPVMNITWDDANSYVRWLSKKTGKAYSLPSEELWDYAAHAGTHTAYPWGDEIGKNHANCRECGSRWGGDSSAPVASFAPNPFGLYDMNGNVWEWTSECWKDEAPPSPRAQIEAECKYRVIRGGAWYYLPPMSKTAARAKFEAKQWSYTLGLRVARTSESGDGR